MANLIFVSNLLAICFAERSDQDDSFSDNLQEIMDQEIIVNSYDECYVIVAIVVMIVMLIVIIDLWCCIDTENNVNEPYYL